MSISNIVFFLTLFTGPVVAAAADESVDAVCDYTASDDKIPKKKPTAARRARNVIAKHIPRALGLIPPKGKEAKIELQEQIPAIVNVEDALAKGKYN